MVADFSLQRTRVISLTGSNSYSRVGHLHNNFDDRLLILSRLGEQYWFPA